MGWWDFGCNFVWNIPWPLVLLTFFFFVYSLFSLVLFLFGGIVGTIIFFSTGQFCWTHLFFISFPFLRTRFFGGSRVRPWKPFALARHLLPGSLLWYHVYLFWFILPDTLSFEGHDGSMKRRVYWCANVSLWRRSHTALVMSIVDFEFWLVAGS